MSQIKVKEFIRFGIVGCFATFIHYGIYLILNLWINTTMRVCQNAYPLFL